MHIKFDFRWRSNEVKVSGKKILKDGGGGASREKSDDTDEGGENINGSDDN